MRYRLYTIPVCYCLGTWASSLGHRVHVYCHYGIRLHKTTLLVNFGIRVPVQIVWGLRLVPPPTGGVVERPEGLCADGVGKIGFSGSTY